ncbi:hypothetical protein LP114_063 [Listeria phage LP-114]|uniref:Transmembrane protein n=1 Tax=Listeria phage LP-114 TaxID=1458857 RepID=A0A059T7L9_9CAUD|nr:hypothetical protein LP114_063 [Listeria phage LP-114]AHL18651.1 hypothetical protein LP114_063 [Listeria phage LP-114]
MSHDMVVWFGIVWFFFGSIISVFSGVCEVRRGKEVADGVIDILAGILLAVLCVFVIAVFL